jgi:hypothetical protein
LRHQLLHGARSDQALLLAPTLTRSQPGRFYRPEFSAKNSF